MVVAPGAASAATLVPLAPPSAWASAPIHATSPPGDPRLFVVERAGTVRIVKDGALQATPFLTVPNVDTANERGLLSIAFAPDYSTSGLFYVFYTAAGADALNPSALPGEVRVVEYRRSASDTDLADPASARLVLKQDHSTASNHNGGQIAFGPDGYLYVTIGDAANSANAQTLGNDLGKVLRINPLDPDGAGTATFGVPPSNPFVATMGANGEIYALGLRNPFRASFAPDDSLIVADVGQGAWEEVEAGNLAGRNFGWPTCEGACLSFHPEFTDPVFQYSHEPTPLTTTGCAIIGGLVVRDASLIHLHGRYLYGDHCRTDLRSLNLGVAGADPQPTGLTLPEPEAGLQSFGEDSSGHVYALTEETVFRIVADAAEIQTTRETRGDNDTTPPTLTLKGAKQTLRGYIEVLAGCSEPCALNAGGALRIARKHAKAATPRLNPAAGLGDNGLYVHLHLKLRKAQRVRARKALNAGRKVSARVTVSATDAAGNTAQEKALVKLGS